MGLIALLLACHTAHTQTFVSGNVSGIWTQTGSPYLVVGDLIVVPGNTLVIQSNVLVRFQGPYVLEVNGTLQALGTSNSPVVFTTTNLTVGWNGIFFNGSDPSSFLTYCNVSGSTNSGIRIQNSTPIIRRCVIANNSSPSSGGGIDATLASGTLMIENCTIVSNVASNQGGGAIGGGIHLNGNAQILKSVIANNTCFGGSPRALGGGIGIDGGSVEIRNSTITGNLATGPYFGWSLGGGIFVSPGSLSMINCLVTTNQMNSGGEGSAIFVWSGPTKLVNCTIVGNSELPVRNYSAQSLNLTNTIIYHNSGSEGFYSAGVTNISYCDIQGGVPSGTSNISFDPGLDAVTLSPLAGSPCIDTGNPDPAYNDSCDPPSFGPPRGYTWRNDMGAFGGPGACAWLAGDAPTIIQQPKALVSCLGQSPSFTVTAIGSLPLSYQWYFNGGILSGKTDVSLTLTNVQPSQAGAYFVVVSNVFGNLTSTTNQLTVNDACLDIRMYAGLTVAGQSGSNYVLSYTTNLGNPNGWIPLATNLMGSSNWFYLDIDSPFSPHRFYKAVLTP